MSVALCYELSKELEPGMHHLLEQDQKGGLARKSMQDAFSTGGSFLFSRQTSLHSYQFSFCNPNRALAESD